MPTKQDDSPTEEKKPTRRRSTKKTDDSTVNDEGVVEAAPRRGPALSRPPDDAPLALKLAWIMQDVGDRVPEGSNKHFSYAYFTDKQLSGIFQQRLASFGIIMVPNVLNGEVLQGQTKKGDPTWLTNLHVSYTFIDGHTGQTIVATGYGQGDDPGDKGANKAFTGATKYTLLKMFLIGGESDAEADEATDQRNTSPNQTTRTEKRPAKVEGSQTGTVERGGRSVKGIEAQVLRVRQLAGELNMGAPNIAQVVKNTLDIDVDLSPGNEGPDLVRFLGSLKADDLGKIIVRLEEAKSRSDTIDKDFDEAGRILQEGMDADASDG